MMDPERVAAILGKAQASLAVRNEENTGSIERAVRIVALCEDWQMMRSFIDRIADRGCQHSAIEGAAVVNCCCDGCQAASALGRGK